MSSSPYRQAEYPSITIRGEPSLTVFAWAAWFSAAVLGVIVLAVDDPHRARIALLASGACMVGVVALLHRAARRVRWLLTLRGSQLQIDRRAGASSTSVGLDVGAGVSIGLDTSERAGSIDPCIVLVVGDRRVAMTTGARPAEALDRVAAFLRENDVPVTELARGPVVWSDGGTNVPGPG